MSIRHTKLTRAALAVCVGLCGTTAVAEPDYYACVVTKTGNFFTEEIVFSVDVEEGAAMVVDAMIYYFNDGRGREAKIGENTARKTVLTWDLPMTNRSGQNTMMRFRAVLQRPSMRLLLSATPPGYRSHFTGRGACQPAEVELEGF